MQARSVCEAGYPLDYKQPCAKCGARDSDRCRYAVDHTADMIEALERTLSWLTSYPGGGAMPVYEQARAALKKAKGE